jgi:hypothetical protein
MCFVFQIYCWVRLVDIISMSISEKTKIISPVFREKKIQTIIERPKIKWLPGQKFYSLSRYTLDTGKMKCFESDPKVLLQHNNYLYIHM